MKGSIAVIRNRYQLTIPQDIRKYLTWIESQRVVRLILLEKGKVLVEPYQAKTISWSQIWQNLKKIKNLGTKTDLAKFVVADRASH